MSGMVRLQIVRRGGELQSKYYYFLIELANVRH